MKRFLLTFSIILSVAISAMPYDFKSGKLYYEIRTSSTVVVTDPYDDYHGGAAEMPSYAAQGLAGKLVIPESVAYGGKNYTVVGIDGLSTFANCNKITSVQFPSTLKFIVDFAFVNCKGIKELEIPDNVSEIGNRAFKGCTGLTELTVGKSLIYIGENTFEGCTNLINVTWRAVSLSQENDNSSRLFTNTPNIKTFTFAYGVEKIPMNLCKGLSALTSVTIPATVKEIGASAFADCGALTSVVSYPNPAKVSLGENVFSGISGTNCTLHVKSGYLSAYKAAVQWKDFPNIIGDAELAGDIDGNSKVDSTDVSILLELVLAGSITYLPAADLNGDGNIDSVDVSIILEHVLAGD